MGLFIDSLLAEVAVGVATIAVVLYMFFTRNFIVWLKKGVPFLKPTVFFGNFKDVLLARKTVGVQLKDIYSESKGKPYLGIFAFDQPLFLVRDIDLVKMILVKDFNYFVDRSFRPDKDRDPMTHRGLFGSKGTKWRHLRVKLTPTFTSGKMKRMFPLVDGCGKTLLTYIDKHSEDGVLEVKDAMARFTTDVISSCAFGIEGEALTNDKSVFRTILARIFNFTYVTGFAMITAFFAPHLLSALKLQSIDSEVVTFLRKTVWDNVEYREKNQVVRKDFLDLMMQIRNKGQVEDDDTKSESKKPSDNLKIDGDDFVAQCFVFLIAGFETSSTTMTFALYELSVNTDIQSRLREEITSVLQKTDGQVTYDGIMEMTYLDKVVQETLRKYPVLPFLDRIADRPYTIPGTNIQLQKNSVVIIPVMGIHYDPEFYPNPERFDPEHFSEERKRARPNYTHLPFGEGPRNCIGNRMGLMQAKVGLVHILANYEVKLSQKTPVRLEYDPLNILLNIKGTLPLCFTKLPSVPAA